MFMNSSKQIYVFGSGHEAHIGRLTTSTLVPDQTGSLTCSAVAYILHIETALIDLLKDDLNQCLNTELKYQICP